MAWQEVHESEQRERKKTADEKREEENEWSAGETVWAAVFSVRCYGNLQSWSSAQGRHQCFTKSRQNYSPGGVKSSKKMRTQSSRTEEFTLILQRLRQNKMTKRSVLVLTAMNSSGMNGAPTSKLFIVEVTLLVVMKVC